MQLSWKYISAGCSYAEMDACNGDGVSRVYSFMRGRCDVAKGRLL